MEEPQKLNWPVRFGKLVEAVTDDGVDEEINFLKSHVREEDNNSDDWPDRLFCDCTSMTIIDQFEDVIAVVPLHQIASVGLLPSQNILSLRIGDVNMSKDLFDLLIIYVPTVAISKEICQHFVLCFQFIYREAIAEFEKEEFLMDQQHDLEEKFIPAVISSSSSSSCSSPISSIQQQFNLTTNSLQIEENVNNNYLITNSSDSTSSNYSTINICGGDGGGHVEQINEYLTILSASLSHDELNKFAILLRRWRSREIPILEFAQNLLELYGPERKHLLARMRSLLCGDPTEIEALGNFLLVNDVVENAAASFQSQPQTSKIILGEGKISRSCPQSSTNSL